MVRYQEVEHHGSDGAAITEREGRRGREGGGTFERDETIWKGR